VKLGAILTAVVFGMLATVALAAGTPQQQAVAQACFARADIGSETANLAAEVVSPGTPANVQSHLQAIKKDLTTIRSTLRNLPPALRQRFVAATAAFLRGMARLTPTLVRAPAGPAPTRQFVRFHLASQLATPVFQQTLGQVPC
jgi:hypothetical protein